MIECFQTLIKTKVMLITTSQKRLHLNDVLNLTYNSDIFKNVNNDKVLGVFIDNNLTWSIHMQSIAKIKTERVVLNIEKRLLT